MKHLPLAEGEFLLQKFSGKGGWTYAAIPTVKQDKNNPFGWVKVKGQIDGFKLDHYKLMPMGNGSLFLPVKKEIRKVIQKEAGDYVHIVLYKNLSLFEIPLEIEECFKLEENWVRERFINYSEGEQKRFIDWIYQAKTDETKSKRILKMMKMVAQNIKFGETIKTYHL